MLLAVSLLVLQAGLQWASGEAGAIDYCYSDLGCFPLSANFYHPRHRPINARPWHRRRIDTRFEVFTRAQPEGARVLAWDERSLAQSGFEARLETKVIVPGWLDSVQRALWVRRLRDALLWHWPRCNVVVLHWRNFTPYTLATANTRVVGAELANLLRWLELRLAYKRQFVHIIGHSLGAHIAGYAGDRLPGLGRISALDPARPFFQHMPKSVRLDRGDAKFVDAIHSDFTPENAILLLMSYGMTTPVGHLDFYPNGPALLQPGCLRDAFLAMGRGAQAGREHNSVSLAFLEAVRYITACDHQRSHEWFTESVLNRQCLFVGVRCDHFEGLLDGRCTCDDSRSACAIMGIHADQMYQHGCHEDLWPAGRHRLRAPSAAAGPTREAQRQQLAGQLLARQAGRNLTSGAPLAPAANPFEGPLEASSAALADLESWYENTSRWHLKTNDQPNYCVNQYQLLVYFGQLLDGGGWERRLSRLGRSEGPPAGVASVAARLVITLLGDRGQLVEQIFEPRGHQLDSYTMQPFLVLLEGSYSLGTVQHVWLSWQPRPRRRRRKPPRPHPDSSFEPAPLAQLQEAIGDGRPPSEQLEELAEDFRPRAELACELGPGGASSCALGPAEGPPLGQHPWLAPGQLEELSSALLFQQQASQLAAQLAPAHLEEPEPELWEPQQEEPAPDFQQLAIEVRKLVVSPLHAHYGRPGRRAARVFCPKQPGARLGPHQTLRLVSGGQHCA